MTTDNGPPFHSKEFQDFAKYLNIQHRHITPLWPQANSSAENFNRRIRKVIQSAKLEQKNWRQEMFRFLRNYRATPHSSTGKPPSELMFSRRTYRTRLPEVKPLYDDGVIRERDGAAKRKMKMYADNHSNVKNSNFQLDDTVLVKQKKVNKLTPPFDPNPMIIIAIKGSMITAKSRKTNKEITRNSSFFKKINDCQDTEFEIFDEEDNSEIVDNVVGENRRVIPTADENTLVPRRNPIRERNRPQYLQSDMENLINYAQGGV